MRIKQCAYLGIKSTILAAPEVTARLGIEPDEFKVRGSRSRQPPIPMLHIWMVKCDERNIQVDEQISRILDRLEPYKEKLAAVGTELASHDPPGHIVLQVVRYFDDEEGEEEAHRESIDSQGQVWERLPGQHQLLGWHLEARVLRFLDFIGAELDVDEYG